MEGTLDQLTFAFGHAVRFTEADFLVSPANRDAHGWVERWPDWPSRILYLYGAPGSGKTHLAHLWARKAGAGFIALDQLEAAAAAPPPAAVVEYIHLLNEHEEALLHLYNGIKETNGWLLLTACFAPSRLDIRLPDLSSRLKSLPSAHLKEPDDALLAAVLRKHFQDRQLAVGEEVLDYLLARMERSFGCARSLAERLDARSLKEKRKVSIGLAKEVCGF